ncbi:MAG: hypothetical protein [Circular genetic element sp.]|nr:MAG: hypothetical protein [Circular genetic element sp.]
MRQSPIAAPPVMAAIHARVIGTAAHREAGSNPAFVRRLHAPQVIPPRPPPKTTHTSRPRLNPTHRKGFGGTPSPDFSPENTTASGSRTDYRKRTRAQAQDNRGNRLFKLARLTGPRRRGPGRRGGKPGL